MCGGQEGKEQVRVNHGNVTRNGKFAEDEIKPGGGNST